MSQNDMSDKVVDINGKQKLDIRQRRKLQHELKCYMEQYFKAMLGKGVDYTKVVIFEDVLLIRGEGFLTEPELHIVKTAEAGHKVVRAARMEAARQHAEENIPYFEELLQAKVIHQTNDIEAENNFWMHTIIFDRILTE